MAELTLKQLESVAAHFQQKYMVAEVDIALLKDQNDDLNGIIKELQSELEKTKEPAESADKADELP